MPLGAFKTNTMKTTEDQEKQEVHNRIAKLLFGIMVMYFIFSNI